MSKTIYATMLESEPGLEIVHCGAGSDGLRDCQAYAQRLTEKNQGVATVGIFQPLTKEKQRDIAKWQGANKKAKNKAQLYVGLKSNIKNCRGASRQAKTVHI